MTQTNSIANHPGCFVLINCSIINKGFGHVQAIAVINDRIVRIGSNSDVLSLIEEGYEVISHLGHTLFFCNPGKHQIAGKFESRPDWKKFSKKHLKNPAIESLANFIVLSENLDTQKFLKKSPISIIEFCRDGRRYEPGEKPFDFFPRPYFDTEKFYSCIELKTAEYLRKVNKHFNEPKSFEELKALNNIPEAYTGPVHSIKDMKIKCSGSAGRPIQIRIYTPKGKGLFPGLVYYHGGAWTFSDDFAAYDDICSGIASKAKCVVVAVNYRLAPENVFPAAVDDSYNAFEWVMQNAKSIGIDSSKIAVGGDSAGGNLAAVVCLKTRSNPKMRPIFQLLIYPSLNLASFDTESFKKYAFGYDLSIDEMQEARAIYLTNKKDWSDWQASPILAKNFSNLPKTLIINAQFDVLCDEATEYAAKLKKAGVDVTYTCYKKTIHGFLSQQHLPASKLAYGQIASALVLAFSRKTKNSKNRK